MAHTVSLHSVPGPVTARHRTGSLWQTSGVSETAPRGRGRPPAAKSADTRARILRTAREVFCEVGYDAATFQEIAVRADLTRPAINHYFPSKRELYREIVEKTNNAIIEAGVEEARRYGGFVDRMHAFIRSTAGTHGGDRSAAAFLVTSVLESQRHPELAEPGHDALASTRDFVAWALDEARSSGELRADVDLETVTEAVVAMVIGMGFYAGFGTRPQDGDKRLAAITDEFLRMLGGEGFLRPAAP